MKEKYIYIYNDTFISLLNLINILISKKIIPLNIKDSSYNPNLLDEVIILDISEDENIIKKIKNKLGSKVLKTIYYIFLSTDEYKELIIYYFLVFALKYKNKVFAMINLNSISKGLKLSKYVSRENHKFKGFLRFIEINNHILYAKMEPTNNIIFIITNHFKERLKNEYWIIHDTKRKIMALYDKKEVYFIHEENIKLDITTNNKEKDIELLWKNFYKNIGIQERKNDLCRMNFMPKKYWKYIIEMSDEYEEDNK